MEILPFGGYLIASSYHDTGGPTWMSLGINKENSYLLLFTKFFHFPLVFDVDFDFRMYGSKVKNLETEILNLRNS